MTELTVYQAKQISIGLSIRDVMKRMDKVAPSNEHREGENKQLREIWNKRLNNLVEEYIELCRSELENKWLSEREGLLDDDMQDYLERYYDDFLERAKEYIINL